MFRLRIEDASLGTFSADQITLVNSNYILTTEGKIGKIACSNVVTSGTNNVVSIVKEQDNLIISMSNVILSSFGKNVYVFGKAQDETEEQWLERLQGIRFLSGVVCNVEPVSIAVGDMYMNTDGVLKISDGERWRTISAV